MTKQKDSAEKAILACIKVRSKPQYTSLCKKFTEETCQVQKDELLEKEDKLLRDRYFIHDRFSQVIFRVRDDKGFPVKDYDLILTAGKEASANHLPEGFFQDRQHNRINSETITYYFNYNVMKGMDEVKDKESDKVIREAIKGISKLGLQVKPRPNQGFVHYLPCEIQASAELLNMVLLPNGTTLIDIQLRRVVHSNVFDLEKVKDTDTNFSKAKPSGMAVP